MANISIEQAMALIKKNADKAVREIIKETAAPMITRTPVKSGNARGNWNTSINTPDASTAKSQDVSGQGSVRRMNSVADRSKRGDTVYVVNNVSYIEKLERGDTTRKATGMRAMAVAEFKVKAEIVAAKVRNS